MLYEVITLLDYMIYNSNDEFVSLEKELEILNSYIELRNNFV